MSKGVNALTEIKFFRIKAGKTQEELAKAIGVTQGAVAQWESGITNPKISNLKAIAQSLGCTLADLLSKEAG